MKDKVKGRPTPESETKEPPHNIPVMTVSINLTQRSPDRLRFLHDELSFNLKTESVDDVLDSLKPVFKRADLVEAFISFEASAEAPYEWEDGHGVERDWEFTEKP